MSASLICLLMLYENKNKKNSITNRLIKSPGQVQNTEVINLSRNPGIKSWN